jgi:DNA polymerase I-like protein with 3'-5' exonuclease and polymerase domains
VNFGFAYGMGEEHFQTYARDNYGTIMTREEAHLAREAYFLLYSDLERWHARSLRETEARGYTETPWGRRRHYNPDEDDMLSCINTPIQSTASDFNLYAMVKADARFRELKLDAKIIGTVHDSILVDADAKQARDVARVLQHEMENLDTSPFGFTCPIKLEVETKVAGRWS